MEKAEFAQDPLDTSKQTRLKALLDLQTIIQSQDMPQDQLMIIRDRVAELAVKIRPQPPAAARPAALTGPGTAYPGVPYTTSTPPVVSQQPTPVPLAAAVLPPAAAGRAGVSIDSIFGQGALATLLSGATRQSATPQQQTPTPQPNPPLPALGPAAAAAIAAALRSPPSQTPAQPVRPAAAPPPSDPSALLAMLRQSGLIKPGATPTPPPAGAVIPPLPGFLSTAGVAADGGIELKPASLKM